MLDLIKLRPHWEDKLRSKTTKLRILRNHRWMKWYPANSCEMSRLKFLFMASWWTPRSSFFDLQWTIRGLLASARLMARGIYLYQVLCLFNLLYVVYLIFFYSDVISRIYIEFDTPNSDIKNSNWIIGYKNFIFF